MTGHICRARSLLSEYRPCVDGKWMRSLRIIEASDGIDKLWRPRAITQPYRGRSGACATSMQAMEARKDARKKKMRDYGPRLGG